MRTRTLAAVLALVAGAALPAAGQTCAGYPTGLIGFYFGGRMDFPEGLNSVGVEGAFNLPGPLAIHGGVNVVSVEDAADSAEDFYLVGGSLDVASLATPIVGPRVSLCPVVEVVYSDQTEGTVLAIPVGVGVGASLGIPGIAAHGYAQPRVVFTRVSGTVAEDVTETDLGLKLGAGVTMGLFTVGGEINHVVTEDADPVLAIRLGIRL